MFTLELQHWQTQSTCHRPPSLFRRFSPVFVRFVLTTAKEIAWFPGARSQEPEPEPQTSIQVVCHGPSHRLCGSPLSVEEYTPKEWISVVSAKTRGGSRCHNRKPQLILHRLVGGQEVSSSSYHRMLVHTKSCRKVARTNRNMDAGPRANGALSLNR